MEKYHLDEFVGGWIIGDFAPSVLRTKEFEVCVKRYVAGDREASHHHKIAEEITVVAVGAVRMAGQSYGPGDIICIPPHGSTDFEALEDTVTVVVKRPSVIGDKYVDEPARLVANVGVAAQTSPLVAGG